MNPNTTSEDFWLPQWTPSSLVHKHFFEFHLKERKEWPLEYVQGQTLFPETLDIRWVDNTEQAVNTGNLLSGLLRLNTESVLFATL